MRCSMCQKVKSSTEFPKVRRNIFGSVCLGCIQKEKDDKAKRSEQRAIVSEKKRKEAAERSREWRAQQVGMTLAQYDKRHLGKCHICGSSERVGVDARGVLCKRCSAGLGFFRRDGALLKRAMEYLSGVTKTKKGAR